MKHHLRQRAFKEVQDPALLEECIQTSENYFGWFTERYPRVFEYTWIVDQARQMQRGVVLDIGAGASPVPLILAKDGWSVTTIDRGEQRVEWGYVDYSELDNRITSKNADFLKSRTKDRYNLIYSISVFEHLKKAERIKGFEWVNKHLEDDGIFMMTIDLEKGTDNIWNRNYGMRIEMDHGTIDDLANELQMFSGFNIYRQTGISGTAIDLLYVEAFK